MIQLYINSLLLLLLLLLLLFAILSIVDIIVDIVVSDDKDLTYIKHQTFF